MSKKAFTLAEVLITLGIIGVVASLTIPSLINNVKNQQYLTALKKNYSTLNEALSKYAADANCPNDLECAGFSKATFPNFVNNYLRIVKNCAYTTSNECFATSISSLNSEGIPAGINNSYYRFTLADGSQVAASIMNNCFKSDWIAESNPFYLQCGYLYLDVNGNKPPNKTGRDIFMFYISGKKGLFGGYGSQALVEYQTVPDMHWDSDASSYNCRTDVDSYGLGCASRIIEEGWQMKY